jgi:hypothetical protein
MNPIEFLTIYVKVSSVTIEQIIEVSFIHPCKQTVITSSQTIPVLQYRYGDLAALQYDFEPFKDSVSSEWN